MISGTVRALDGDPAEGVCVIVCDAASGIPLDSQTHRPFTDDASQRNEAFERILFATTGEDGSYELSLPPGAYRLVAQAWDETPAEILGVNGVNVRLYGTTGTIDLDEGESETADLKPAGACLLSVHAEAGNDESLFVVSAAPTRADPILGFAGWVGPFVRGMLGGNRAPGGRTVFHGLPEGETHVAVFSADNIPGWGGASVTLEAGRPLEVDVPWVVSWSDGVHSPPPRLESLTDLMTSLEPNQHSVLLSRVMRIASLEEGQDPLAQMGAMGAVLDEPIELPSGHTAPLGDVVAAVGYAMMRQGREASGRPVNPYRRATVRPYEPEARADP